MRSFILTLSVFCCLNGQLKIAGQTTSNCLEIQRILVDACAPPPIAGNSQEFRNEMLQFLVGPTPLNIATMSINFGYGQFFQGIRTPDGFTGSKVAALNANVQACGRLIEPVGGILPANSKVLWISSYDVSTISNSFADLSETLYVIFHNSTFSSDAYFINYAPSNTTAAPDNITVRISFGGACFDQVTYNRPSLITQAGFPGSQDGASVLFDFNGTPTYINRGCQAPVPVVSAEWTSPGTVCSNVAPINLVPLVTGTAGGTFSGSGVSGNVFNPSGLSGSVNITYTVPGSGSCPPATQTRTITVNPFQQASWTPPASPVCQGTTLNLAPLITGASGGTWSGQGVSGSTFNSSGLSGNINITYSLGSGTCQSVSTQAIQVITAGNPAWTPPASICNNAPPIELSSTVTGNSGGAWTGQGVSSGGQFNPSGLNGSIAITYTVGTGSCTAFSTQNIQVLQGGSAAWTVPPSICSNNPPLDLNNAVTGTSGGSWSGSGVTSGGSFNPSGLNGTIAITYTVGTGVCQATLTQNIQVTASGNAQWSAPSAICNTAPPLNLTTLVSGNPGGTWSGNGVSANGIFNPAGLNGSQNITYSVGSGSCAASETRSINVSPAPVAPIVTGKTSYCSGETFTALSASGVTGAIFRWYADANLNNLLGSGNTFTPAAGFSGIIYVTQDVTGCTSPATPVNITINPRPQTPSVQSPVSFCAGSTLPLLSATGSGGTITWYADQALTSVLSTGANYQLVTPGSSNYYATESSAGGCRSLPAIVVVTELPLTTAEITPGGPVSICTSEPVLLTSSSTTGNLWSTGETTQSITVTATGTVTLTVSGTCNNATDQVIIQPADVNAAFSVSDSIGFAPLQVNIVNESTNSASCAWFVNQTPSSAPETGSITFDTPGTYNITLECVSNNGCIDKETHIILIKPAEVTFWVPNTFSPNSDGKNEVFKAYGTGIERINAEIYNRWGIKIYEWNDFNEGWDGTMDGRVVQDDIYIYRFDVWDTNGKKFTTRGKILVLQNSASD